MGACVIEKHFTDDCSRLVLDHSFALSPSEFSVDMVKNVHDLKSILGTSDKSVQPRMKRHLLCPTKKYLFI